MDMIKRQNNQIVLNCEVDDVRDFSAFKLKQSCHHKNQTNHSSDKLAA